MTLLKSSDKSFITMFKNKLKSGFTFPLLGFIVLLYCTVISPFLTIVGIENGTSYLVNQEGLKIENIRYFFSPSLLNHYGNPMGTIFLHMVLIICAIICAVMVFKDLSSKRTANIYYSLGFSRKTLFMPTYLAGAACVTAMVLVPYLLAFIINAFVFGVTKELLIALIFSALAYLNMSLVAYTIASIAMVMSGMLVEGTFFAFFLNGIPTLVAFSISLFSDALLTGGKLSTNEINSVYYSPLETAIESIFLGKLKVFNSLAHSFENLNSLGSCMNNYAANDYTSNYITIEHWTSPNWIPLICWTVILAGLFFLSLKLFENKKPEDIGFFASNKALYRVLITFSILTFSSLGCIAGKTISKGLTWLYILIIIAVMLVLTLIFKLILTKVARFKIKEERKYFLMYAGVTVLFAFVFSSGFFGYTNRIPAVEKVKSVEVTALSSGRTSYYSNPFYTTYRNNNMGETSAIMFDGIDQYGYSYEFKTASEISKIQDIHKTLIKIEGASNQTEFEEFKIGTVLTVKYNLKNGKTIDRCYYYVNPQIIEKYAEINTASENIKDEFMFRAEKFLTMEDNNAETDREKFITVFTSDMLKAEKIDLTEAQRIGLVESYRKDIENMTALEILDPEIKTIGLITTREDNDVNDENGYVMGSEKEIEFETFNEAHGGDGYIFIKENMKNTVQWAKDNGVYELMQPDYSMSNGNIEATYNDSSSFKSEFSDICNINLIFQTRAGRLNQNLNLWEKTNTCLSPLTGSHVVTGLTNEEMKIIRENAQSFCITNEKGYFIRLTSPATDENVGQMCSVLFIPESKLTPQMKVKFATISDKTEYITDSIAVDTTHVDVY